MKSNTTLIFLFVLLSFTYVNAQNYHETLTNIAEANNLVGMSVVVMCHGENSDVFHYGFSDIDRAIAVSDHTYYRIASISKTVTATALVKLFENGYFALDDDINDYLDFEVRNPDYPQRSITFQMLLSHTSGLQDGSGYSNFLTDSYNETPPPPIAELIEPGGEYYTPDMYAAYEPGSYFAYANINFGLIATLIEQISERRFDLFVKDSVLDPLSISGSFNIDHISDIDNVAVLYRYGNPQADNYQGTHPPAFDSAAYEVGSNGVVFAPQGGLRITAGGLSRFMAMHANNGSWQNNQILEPETVELMHTPVWTYDGTNGNNYYNLFNSWGLGMQLTTNAENGDIVMPGTRMIGHPGEAYGLISDMYFEKAMQFGVIFLTNGYYSGGYDFGDSTAFYVPEEQVFAAVAAHQFSQCDTISTSINSAAIANRSKPVFFDAENQMLHLRNSFPNGILKVINMEGRVELVHRNLSGRLPLDHLQEGIYIVHLQLKNYCFTLKIAIDY